MFNKEDYLQRLDKLIKKGDEFNGGFMLGLEQTADCQYWFSEIITLIQSFTSVDNYFYNEAKNIVRGSKRQGGIAFTEIEMMKGFLRQLYDAITDDLLSKIKNQITVEDFRDFLAHAKHYAAEGKKKESSVIASSIFEDTIKKIALKNGIEDISKLDSVINALKSRGIISSTESKKFKYYSGIRNASLHASWDEFTIEDINDMIKGNDILLKDYLM